MAINIVALSDLHGVLPEIPACDLVLIAGDICPTADHDIAFQAEWLDTEFRRWLQSLQAEQIVFVAGNHDFVFERESSRVPRDLPAVYLQDAAFVWRGLKIWGTPWQPWFFDWAFNLREPELALQWNLIPADTDILVLHGPPRGFGDGVLQRGGVRHTGSPSLLARIEQVCPKLVVFGHIHEGRGEWRIGDTLLANVTILDEKYRHVYPPWQCSLE